MEHAAILNLEELIRQDFDEYLGGTRDFSNAGTYLNTHKHFSWQWPKEMGKGLVSYIRLRDGLTLSIGNALLHEPVRTNFENWHLPLVFSYGVSGNTKYTFESEHNRPNNWYAEPGQGSVICLREFAGKTDYPANIPLEVVSIYIEPGLLGTLVDLKNICIPESLRDLANGADAVEYQKNFTTSPAVDMVVHQILNCPYQEPFRQLYLEGQALTLLTHTLAGLVPPDNKTREAATIRPQDIERVKQARELLCSNLQNPPTLLELARTVGLHHSKLNTGFRKIYGTTTFGYLRQARLVMAKAFLDDGRMNVTETAFAVGYSSPSHLAKAFKKFYGTSPHAYLRAVASKW